LPRVLLILPRVLVLLSTAALLLLSGPATTPGMQPARTASFKDCPHCPEMLPVAPGSFAMGDEKPPRKVTIDYRFAYSKDKVSFRDWKHCVLGGQCPALGATGSASLEPVVQVSWVDVQQYLSWLSLETGAEYRLLSESEWEYLARRPASGVAAEGLEWTSDCWHPSLAAAPTDGSSWDADGDCRYHVARGRRPGEPAPSVTKRYRFLFDARDGALGFRVARTM
jgi:formylglycine-generating enzyme required for sulfatase activity